MNAIIQAMKTAARIIYVTMACVLVAMIFLQVFHAGMAVLVSPGDWGAHRSFGSLISLPIMLMALLSLLGWMPIRFFLLSLGLYGLYLIQYLLIYLPANFGFPALAALHPVNAMVILLIGIQTARHSWHLVAANWPPGLSARRIALAAAVSVSVLGTAAGGLQPLTWAQGKSAGGQPASLADATEATVPEAYLALRSPIPPADAQAVAAGRQIAEQRCIACHAADFKGKQLGAVRTADLTQSGAVRSEQFLHWAISEGSQRGMPGWKSTLTEEERWHLVTFIKSLSK